LSIDFTHDAIERVSRELDNPLIVSRIILRGSLLKTTLSTDFSKAMNMIMQLCRDRLCFARIHIEKPFRGVLNLYVVNGKVLGVALKLNSNVVYGLEALKNDRVLQMTQARVTIYEFKLDMLMDIAKSLTQYIESLTEVKVVEAKSSKEIIETRQTVPTFTDLRRDIISYLSKLGFDIIDLTLAEGEKVFAVDVIYNKSSPLYNPEEVSLPLVRRLLTKTPIDKDIQISIHYKRTFAKTYRITERDLWIVLGLVPEIILTKYRGGLRLDSMKCRRVGRFLEISITLRRESLYSTVSVTELAREIYNELKKQWNGDLVVRVKIGRFGLEGRAP